MWANQDSFTRHFPLAIALVFAMRILADGDEVSVGDVRAAWKSHADAATSIECRFEHTRTELVHMNVKPNDPFERPVNKDEKPIPVRLTGESTFSRAEKKLALERKGERWDHPSGGLVVQQLQACFDGETMQRLSKAVSISLGEINDAKSPHAMLVNNVELIPLWLAHWPLDQITAINGSSADYDIEATREGMTCGSLPCIELTVTSRRPKRVVHLLYADPSNGFRILKMLWNSKARISTEVNIQYATDTILGWRAAGWSFRSFDPSGDVRLAIEATVKDFKVNSPLAETTFKVEFPIGTRIAKNGKNYIQETGGKLREINDENSDRSPPR